MTGAESIALVGISYRTTPLELRESCAVPAAEQGHRARAVAAQCGAAEAVLLSTCNRTELLLSAEDPERASAAAVAALFPGVSTTYTYRGVEALFHVFRVAAGLESQVVGETQILAQLREAATLAREAGSCGVLLNSVVEQALAAGRRVRSETGIGEGTLSVARAAVDLAVKVAGDLREARVLVVGCGATGLLAGRCLKERNTGELRFANRTLATAEAAAAELGGTGHGLDALDTLLPGVDVVIVAVEAPQPVLRTEHVQLMRQGRRQRPLVLIDISVPRGIAASLRTERDLFVADMDDLASIVAQHRTERGEAAEAAALILVAEVQKFHGLRAVQALKPQVQALVGQFEQVRRALLETHGEKLSLERFSEVLTQRLQDEALRVLKAEARDTTAAATLLERYKNHTQEP